LAFGQSERFDLTGQFQTIVMIDTGLTPAELKNLPAVEQVNLYPGVSKAPSHACKCYFPSYNSRTPKAKVVVIRFYKVLYVNSLKDIAPYLLGLKLSLEWIEKHAVARNITTVQISILDGLYDNALYSDHLNALKDVTTALARLRQRFPGMWISAPTGNFREYGEIFWPARDPLVTAVGCARNGKPILHRSKKVALLMRGGATSVCNAYACALSMLVREDLSRRHPDKVFTTSDILATMLYGAAPVIDTLTGSKLMIAQPERVLSERGLSL